MHVYVFSISILILHHQFSFHYLSILFPLPLYPLFISSLFFFHFLSLIFVFKINAAAEVIYEAVDPNANIIFGALVDESMNGEIAITVIATGFPVMTTAEASKGTYVIKSVHSLISSFMPEINCFEEFINSYSLYQFLAFIDSFCSYVSLYFY